MNHFTVITVVRNDLSGLKRSRASLNKQKYKKWTHIIIDGGSTDGTLEYLQGLPKTNTLFVSEKDSGIYNAMNKGWKLADPESFVYYLNARDVFAHPESLVTANFALKKFPESNWGCTTHEEINEDGTGWCCKLVSEPSVRNQLYAFGYRSHQGVVMRASFIEYLSGFDERYKLASDWDLIVRALVTESPIEWSFPLGRFELGGVSSQKILEAHRELMILRNKYNLVGLNKRIYEELWRLHHLRPMGYENSLTRILNLIRSMYTSFHKMSHFPFRLIHRMNFQLSLLGFQLKIQRVRQKSSKSRKKPRKGNRSRLQMLIFSRNLLITLNKRIELNPYRAPMS